MLMWLCRIGTPSGLRFVGVCYAVLNPLKAPDVSRVLVHLVVEAFQAFTLLEKVSYRVDLDS